MMKRFDWRTIAIHDETRVHGFFGPFRFLSNMYECAMPGDFPSLENAYMASRVIDEQGVVFRYLRPADAKKILKADIKRKTKKMFMMFDKTVEEWYARRESVMRLLIADKFSHELNPDLAEKLIETGDRHLQESNYWGDAFWGVDHKIGGLNVLGQLLMERRSFLINQSKIDRALRMTAESRPRMNALSREERQELEARARKTIAEASIRK